MSFYELLWMGDSFSDAGDLEEAIACFLEVKPKGLDWSDVCGNPLYAPTIRRYPSFDAYLDNEDAQETISVTAAMMEAAAAAAAAGSDPGSAAGPAGPEPGG